MKFVNKKLIILALLSVALNVRSVNVLRLSEVSGHAGDTVTVSAWLTTTDNVSAMQMTLPLSPHLRYVSGSAALNASATQHQLAANSSDETLYLNIFNFTGNALPSIAEPLFTFRLVLGTEPQTYTLSPEVLLSDKTGKQLDVQTTSGSATLLAPKLEILTRQIDYGHIPIRQSYTATLTLRNAGNEPLSISDIQFTAAEFSASNNVFSIAAGESRNITITYSPTKRGAIIETLTVVSNAINGLYNNARRATLTADPFSVNELHVGSATGISDDTVTVTVRVNNMEPLVGAQFSFALPKQLEYVSGSEMPCSRANNHTVQGVVDGNRLTLFLYSLGNSTFDGEDGDLLTFRLHLNGSSGSYALQPVDVMLSNATQENMTSAYDGNYVMIQSPQLSAPTSLQLGDIDVTEKATAALTINNYGQAPLTIERVSFLAEGFSIVEPLPLQIAQGRSKTLTVEYLPSTEGEVSTLMQIYSNDPTNRMHSVAITGQVFEPNGITLTGELYEQGKLVLDIGLKNYNPITALQLDLHLPEGLTPNGSFVPSQRLNGMSSIMQAIGDNTYRLIVYSLSNTAISAGNSSIGTVRIEAETDKLNNMTFTIDNIFLSDRKGQNRQTGSNVEWTYECSYTITVLSDDEQTGTVEITPLQ